MEKVQRLILSHRMEGCVLSPIRRLDSDVGLLLESVWEETLGDNQRRVPTTESESVDYAEGSLENIRGKADLIPVYFRPCEATPKTGCTPGPN